MLSWPLFLTALASGTPFGPTWVRHGALDPSANRNGSAHVLVSLDGSTWRSHTLAHESQPTAPSGNLSFETVASPDAATVTARVCGCCWFCCAEGCSGVAAAAFGPFCLPLLRSDPCYLCRLYILCRLCLLCRLMLRSDPCYLCHLYVPCHLCLSCLALSLDPSSRDTWSKPPPSWGLGLPLESGTPQKYDHLHRRRRSV